MISLFCSFCLSLPDPCGTTSPFLFNFDYENACPVRGSQPSCGNTMTFPVILGESVEDGTFVPRKGVYCRAHVGKWALVMTSFLYARGMQMAESRRDCASLWMKERHTILLTTTWTIMIDSNSLFVGVYNKVHQCGSWAYTRSTNADMAPMSQHKHVSRGWTPVVEHHI